MAVPIHFAGFFLSPDARYYLMSEEFGVVFGAGRVNWLWSVMSSLN